MVNPIKPAPVAAGNLETSQRIVDAIYRALSPALKGKIPAASHGSMNNLLMGGADRNGRSWAFYETIGGGCGARFGADGESGVQVNMTNTMNTPIEVMEHYYPVFFESYKLRKNSGGDGKWVGGLGIERSFRAEADITTTVIGDRSKLRPWGLEGGGPGKNSRYSVIRRGGRSERLESKETVLLHAGDSLVIRTPGGGGYGPSRPRR
jgi:N-methylhydantoinase B